MQGAEGPSAIGSTLHGVNMAQRAGRRAHGAEGRAQGAWRRGQGAEGKARRDKVAQSS
jgi:hypothetical protein